LLDVVADKTGYPKDSLEDGMNLESDLGIDSIKRVEILGALKEKLPAAAALDALQLAQLKTLGEIAAAISPRANASSLLAQLIEVVADKTGYPKDALSASMALESDLGVDSIKRVEILSALKERVPSLPAVEPVKLAQLATIGEIATALEGARPF
jgi:acyl carrier protein